LLSFLVLDRASFRLLGQRLVQTDRDLKMTLTIEEPISEGRVHLVYHCLDRKTRSHKYQLTTSSFEKHVRLATDLSGGKDPVLPPILTFDDGHISQYESAIPILSRFGVFSMFFPVVGWLESRSCMSWQQIRTIYGLGHMIGSHTLSHPTLTHCSDSALKREIRESKDLLENRLGAPVRSIAIPHGKYDKRVLQECEAAGYDRVYTSAPYSRRVGGLHLVGRINVRGCMVDASCLGELFRNKRSRIFKVRASFLARETAKRLFGDRLYTKYWNHFTRPIADS
jgi:hypothetical protein